MKLYIVLRLNEYTSTGYDFEIMAEDRWPMYEEDEDIKLINVVEIDIKDHSSFLAEQSAIMATKLTEKAKDRLAQSIRDIKEFESKFLLIDFVE